MKKISFLFCLLFFSCFSIFPIFALKDINARITPEDAQNQLKKIQENVKKYGPLAEKYGSDDLLKQYEKYYEQNKQYAENYSPKNASDKEKAIQDRNNKLLFEIPIAGPFKVGIYVGDIIRGLFLGADLCVDWYFYNQLTEYCIDNLFKKITNNVDGTIRTLVKVADNLKSKDKNLKKISEDELIKFMEHNFSLDYTSLIKHAFVKHLICYIFLTEISIALKNNFLGQRDIKSLGILWHRLGKPQENSALWNVLWDKPIPISNIIEGLFIASRPLTSGIGYLPYIFNSLLTTLEWRPQFLDSYWLLFVKEASILLLSIKSMYKDIYQKAVFSHLKAFWEEIVRLLKTYKIEKTQFKGTTKENKSKFLETEKEIKEFIRQAYGFSFTFWLKRKNLMFAKNEFWVSVLLNGVGIAGKVAAGYVAPYFEKSENEG